jgi:hypothetical protein
MDIRGFDRQSVLLTFAILVQALCSFLYGLTSAATVVRAGCSFWLNVPGSGSDACQTGLHRTEKNSSNWIS